MTLSRYPLLRSPFRPFFLLGALYGPLLILSWIPLYTGLLPGFPPLGSAVSSLHHQHEMIFGFASAIIFGFILTALPSWAGTREVTGAKLAILVLSWLLGRVSTTLSSWLPLPVVTLLDLSFPLFFALIVAPGLVKVRLRIVVGLGLITAGFFMGNLYFYLGIWRGDDQLWLPGLRIGLYAMIFHCSVTVGALAPIFTENQLREQAQPADIGYIFPLEWLSAAAILALAVADFTGATPAIIGSLALVSALLHGARLSRWRSLSIAGAPLVWVLHVGYLWLFAALLLLALEGLGTPLRSESWVHAFTVGGFGLMSLGLMTRVSLRHTGRELRLPAAMIVAYLCLFAAAVARVMVPLTMLPNELLLLSALLWGAPYVIYLIVFARSLLAPSLP